MSDIAELLFRGYGFIRRKVSVSLSTSDNSTPLPLCIVLVSFTWIIVILSVAVWSCEERRGLVSSSGKAFMLHCSKKAAQEADY